MPQKKSGFKIIRLFFRVIFILFFLIFLTVSFLTYYICTPASDEKKDQQFYVQQGDGARDVAVKLKRDGLIKNELAFRALIKYTKSDFKLKAGVYSLSPHMLPMEILKKMVKGEVLTRKIVIPEGYTIFKIAKLLESNNIMEEKSFLSLAAKFNETLPSKTEKIENTTNGAEGYLFPDTYTFSYDVSPEELIKQMFIQFKEKVFPEYSVYKGDLSLSQVVILASLVEHEARLPDERPKVARVYLNRLNLGMKLECDATIQYILLENGRETKEFLTYDDLKIDSPFNTYLYKGLPPKPIGNPGLAAIKAVLSPAKGKYLFYVVANDKGAHYFSSSYNEHMQAVSRYKDFLRLQGK